MGDSLKVFGNIFNNVQGFKAKDLDNNTLTYTRGGGGTISVVTEQLPGGGEHKIISATEAEGTLIITAPGTYDVTGFKNVEVDIDMWTEQTISTDGAVTQELSPYVIYHFTGNLTSLTITLGTATRIPMYHFDFTTGATVPSLILPNTVDISGSFVLNSHKRYEINILNNYGVVHSWEES